jgi:hypothetical protein
MFKKFTIILSLALVVLLAASSSMQAKFNQSISGNPISLAFGLFNATYEQQIAPKNSFTVFGSYWSYSDWTAGGFGGSYRFYLIQETTRAIEGFSFGPFASVAFWSWNGYGYSYDGGTSIAIGAEAAYKWVFSGGFMVEPIVQISFPLTNITGLSYHGTSVGVNLGYAW